MAQLCRRLGLDRPGDARRGAASWGVGRPTCDAATSAAPSAAPAAWTQTHGATATAAPCVGSAATCCSPPVAWTQSYAWACLGSDGWTWDRRRIDTKSAPNRHPSARSTLDRPRIVVARPVICLRIDLGLAMDRPHIDAASTPDLEDLTCGCDWRWCIAARFRHPRRACFFDCGGGHDEHLHCLVCPKGEVVRFVPLESGVRSNPGAASPVSRAVVDRQPHQFRERGEERRDRRPTSDRRPRERVAPAAKLEQAIGSGDTHIEGQQRIIDEQLGVISHDVEHIAESRPRVECHQPVGRALHGETVDRSSHRRRLEATNPLGVRLAALCV